MLDSVADMSLKVRLINKLARRCRILKVRGVAHCL